MSRRARVYALAMGLLTVTAAVGVWAQGKVKFYTGVGQANQYFWGYTYRNVIDGYPPVPRTEIILGDDATEYRMIPYGYKHECIIDAIQHEVGVSYPWKMHRYYDATKKEWDPNPWATGYSTAY